MISHFSSATMMSWLASCWYKASFTNLIPRWSRNSITYTKKRWIKNLKTILR